jgi:hypothetical protein
MPEIVNEPEIVNDMPQRRQRRKRHPTPHRSIQCNSRPDEGATCRSLSPKRRTMDAA